MTKRSSKTPVQSGWTNAKNIVRWKNRPKPSKGNAWDRDLSSLHIVGWIEKSKKSRSPPRTSGWGTDSRKKEENEEIAEALTKLNLKSESEMNY